MVNPPSPTPQHQEMVFPMVLQPHLRLILLLTKTSLTHPHIRHHSQAFRVLIPLLQGVIRLPKGAIPLPKGVILLLLQGLVGIPLLRTLLSHQGTEDLPLVIFVHLSFLTLWIRNTILKLVQDMERNLDQNLRGKEALGEGCSQAKVFWERQ